MANHLINGRPNDCMIVSAFEQLSDRQTDRRTVAVFRWKGVNAIRQIYKHNVIHILYNRIWFTSGLLCRMITDWPAGSAVTMLSCELNGQGSSPIWAILVTFHFQLNYGRPM